MYLILLALTNLFLNTQAYTESSCYPHDLRDFDRYLSHFNKSYPNRTEYYRRANIYFENVDYINLQNTRNHTYTLGINQFTDISPTEFQSTYLGYRGFNSEYYRYRTKSSSLPRRFYDSLLHYPTISNQPIESIDWRAEGLVTPIKDQAQCGSCWAFSAVATMEGAQAKKSGNLTSLSEQDLVDCVPDCYGCGGGWPTLAIEYVINGSTPNNTLHFSNTSDNNSNISMIDTESSYPYQGTDNNCQYQVGGRGANITGLVNIESGNVASLQDALLTIGPISVAIDVEADFQFYETGFFETTECSETELDHAVTAVGFGTTSDGKKYYIIKNSWGTTWGEDGYIYYSADIPNMCGIAQDACYAT